ncbi:MAG TPA: AAA family ATPase [Candidatus Limnocylindria bacterium]|nr:AAA family ATPase [Candidatus Limnocylindria bacterium]
MIQRSLVLPPRPKYSFFLWGPRQTGKTTMLRSTYPDAYWIDLLDTDTLIRLTQRPARLREEADALPRNRLIVIDEAQKIPALFDEIHWLIENRRRVFVLCGSSARRVRRSHANLLGGRALRYELFGLVSRELGAKFDLVRMLNHGYLPRHYLEDTPAPLIRAYVQDYLKEEVLAEGLSRSLPVFSNFLNAAALSDTAVINYATIARDCGVSAHTVRGYFEVLVDTLLGRELPAYVRRPKRRIIRAPRFFFGDVGVVNLLTRRGQIEPGSELFGKAFENWLHHELSAYAAYSGEAHELSYWRLTTGVEVDFIIDDMAYAVEAKASRYVTADHLRGLRELAREHARIKKRFVVSLDPQPRVTEDGIEVLPHAVFTQRLWQGDLLR